MGGWFGRGLLLCGYLVSAMALADDAFLKIKGDGCCDGKGEVVLTRAEFEALPQTEVKTHTPWTEGHHTYRECCCEILSGYTVSRAWRSRQLPSMITGHRYL